MNNKHYATVEDLMSNHPHMHVAICGDAPAALRQALESKGVEIIVIGQNDHEIVFPSVKPNLIIPPLPICETYFPRKKVRKSKQPPPIRILISRNAQCPCGSGKKYKRCCIDK